MWALLHNDMEGALSLWGFQAHKAQGSGGESRFPLTEMSSIAPAGSETTVYSGSRSKLGPPSSAGAPVCQMSASCRHTLIHHSLLIALHHHTKQNNKHKGYNRDEGNDIGIDSIIKRKTARNLSKDPEEEGTNKECSRLQTQKPKPPFGRFQNLPNINLTNGLWTLDSEVSLGSLVY